MTYFFEHHGMADNGFFNVNRMLGEPFPAHLHIAYELIFVSGGSIHLQVEEKQYVLKEGEMAFIFCNQIHGFTCDENSDITVVIFSPELVGDFYSAYKDFEPVSNVLHPKNLPGFTDVKTSYAQKSLLYWACDLLVTTAELRPADRSRHITLLQQIFAYIDKHYGENCSLKSLVKELQYDYAYISKLFTRLAGVHFNEYLNNYRISQACYMLDRGGHTVSEIAELCGYATMRSFHRNFKKVTLLSPQEYRAEKLRIEETQKTSPPTLAGGR